MKVKDLVSILTSGNYPADAEVLATATEDTCGGGYWSVVQRPVTDIKLSLNNNTVELVAD